MNMIDIADLLSHSAKNPLPPQLAGWDPTLVTARMGTVFTPPYAPAVDNVTYGQPVVAEEPPEELDRTTVVNKTSVPLQEQVSLGRATQESIAITVAQGVHTSETMNLSVGYPPYFGLQFGESVGTD